MSRGRCGGSKSTTEMPALGLDAAFQSRDAEITSVSDITATLCCVSCESEHVQTRAMFACVRLLLPARGPLRSVFPVHPRIFCGHPARTQKKEKKLYLCPGRRENKTIFGGS